MKIMAILFGAMLLGVSFVAGPVSADRTVCVHSDKDDLFRDDNVSVEIEDGTLIFTHDNDDETVEITEEYELIVNGRSVHLDAEQRRLVREYYDSFESLIEEAKEIGLQGAKIGVQGAKLGLVAVVGVLKLLSPDYDESDLEADLEIKGEKIERVAAKLEKRANRLEHRAKKLERQHERLREEIEELDELGWF